MCGFAGTVSLSGDGVDWTAMQRASDAIHHRGPDDVGYMSWSTPGEMRLAASTGGLPRGRIGVAHRRLSILDLSEAGRQPMVSADGRHAIAFNGEIYNYLELRGPLERNGRAFATGTDTEVLLNGLINEGTAFLPRLTGMFAFAYFDFENRTVLFARDFAGIKPLYFFQGDDRLAFGSEIRALLPLMPSPVRGHVPLVLDYLIHGLIEHSDESIIAGVHQLSAGSWIEFSLDDLTVKGRATFWEVPTDTIELSFDEAVRQVRELFEKNIMLHMRSDVPVAATLSGGLDSSAITCMMRHLNGPDAEIHSFSYLADDEQINEEPWSDAAAARAKTVQHKVRLSSQEFVDELEDLIVGNDLPLGGFNAYIGWNLFRATRNAGIKVSLDGQGADEILCGYDHFAGIRFNALIRQGRWREAYRLHPTMPGVVGQSPSWARFARRVARTAIPKRSKAAFGCPSWLSPDVFASYCGPSSRSFAAPWDPVKLRLADDFSVSSLPRLLRCFDRQAMAHSVENRVPFLTPELAEFLFRLPSEYLIDARGERKKVLRHAVRGLIPDSILDRKDKIAARTPNWLFERRDAIGKRLTADRLFHISIWKPDLLQQSWQKLSQSPQGDYGLQWRILNLSEWARLLDVQI